MSASAPASASAPVGLNAPAAASAPAGGGAPVGQQTQACTAVGAAEARLSTAHQTQTQTQSQADLGDGAQRLISSAEVRAASLN